MKSIFFMLIGLWVATALPAQQTGEIMQLSQDISIAPDDSFKVQKLREQAEDFIGIKTDSALLLAKKSFDLSVKINYEKGKAISQFTIGKIFVFIGNYSRGLELYLHSLEINERLHETEWIAINLTYIGEVYSYLGDYQQSLHYFLRGSSIAEINKLNNTLAKVLMNIGKIYETIGKLDSASYYIEKSYSLIKKHNDYDYDYLTGKILYSLGELYFKTGDYPKAMTFYRLGMAESNKVQDYAVTCNSSLGIANFFNSKANSDSGVFYARQSLAIAMQANFMLQQLNAVNFLSQFYKGRKQFDSAFKYQEISIALKDSLISKEKIREFQQISFSNQFRQQEIEQAKIKYDNKIKILVLLCSLSTFMVVALVLWRNKRQKQKANILLTTQKIEIDKQKHKIEASFKDLQSAQAQLIQSEKMASLGELTAGIAHEIQNPLNFVNNFSEVNKEMLEELKAERLKPKAEREENLEDDILNDVITNSEKINHHGKRADAIVKGILQHSSSGSGKKEPTDINKLADEYLRLAYHGLRAKDKSFNAILKTDFDKTIGNINIIPQDIGRVIFNLITNAFYAVAEKKKIVGESYEPLVSISTSLNLLLGARGP